MIDNASNTTSLTHALSESTGISFQDALKQDRRWAMVEGSRFFEREGKVHETLRRLAKELNEAKLDYVIAGGMALYEHGFRRFTEDVDLLVNRETLKLIHEQFSGRGYIEPFSGSKNLRDTTTGVKIDFLIAGDYPGDGKPKDIAFPDPVDVREYHEGIPFIQLGKLIELKLASGLSAQHREKDFSDVRGLVTELKLPRDFSNSLHSSVQAKYKQIWDTSYPDIKRYYLRWRIPTLSTTPNSWSELQQALPARIVELQAMEQAGIQLTPEASKRPTDIWYSTNDWQLAEQYDMHPLDEWMD